MSPNVPQARVESFRRLLRDRIYGARTETLSLPVEGLEWAVSAEPVERELLVGRDREVALDHGAIAAGRLP